MVAKSIAAQARDFLYELANCASEYGFSKEELWELSLVSIKQKTILEKKYYPVISVLLLPETVPMMPALVGEALDLVIAGMEQNGVKTNEPQYLLAYQTKRTLN